MVRRPIRYPSVILAAGLTLLHAADAAAFSDSDCSRLKTHLSRALASGRRWLALELAARCAAVPGLPDPERGAALRAGAEIRLLVGDLSGAERDLRRALKLLPGDPEAAYDLAQAIRDRPTEALSYSAEAAEALPSPSRRAAALRLTGAIRLDLGERAAAEEAFTRALGTAPGDLDALEALTRLAPPDQAVHQASAAARAAAAAPPWFRGDAFRLSARIWLEAGNRAEAAAALTRALELDADDLDALRALMALKIEDPSMALDVRQGAAERAATELPSEDALLSALKADPEDLDALRGLISIRRLQSRWRDAVSAAERFLEAVPRTPLWRQASAYRLISRIWSELGERERAEQCLQLALNLDLTSPQTAFLLHRTRRPPLRRRLFGVKEPDLVLSMAYRDVALARAALGDEDGAEETFTRALQAGPEDAFTLMSMGEFYLQTGRPVRALPLARRAVLACPKPQEACRADAGLLVSQVQSRLGAPAQPR